MHTRTLLRKQWIFEGFLPGEPKTFLAGFALRRVLYSHQSSHQRIEIIEAEGFGKILFLDGLVQLSTLHEHVYHEMLVHPALCAHPHPQKVLIIGGGDGGALREVLRHPVEEAYLVDIDEEVIRVSQKYLPSVSQGSFHDPRTSILIGDGNDFISQCRNYFDSVILDVNDPDKQGTERLFQRGFFAKVKKALKPNGIFAVQTGYFSETFGMRARKDIARVFPFTQCHRAFVKCFPRDEHTFSFGSFKINLKNISLADIKKRLKDRNIATSYYSPEIHASSNAFPLSEEKFL